ncbi:MAG TPA: DHA2 family efflux MFS transporter permease subunit [Anaeromyxobacteraceae bacterium]|nr:DHA2 family efflux MFS transporter permease subunit [Anaeromyxobacteraceae bacterium]
MSSRPLPESESSPPMAALSATAKRIVPWLCGTALFMELLDATIVNTAVPTMAAALRVEPLSLKTVLTSYTLSLAIFIPVSGWMADRFGTRRVFASAVSVFLVGSLACGLSVNVPMLVGSRLLQGAGGAMMTPVGRLVLVRTFPRKEFLRAMNYVVMPSLIGPLIGPFVGGLIVHWIHWRAIFFLNIPPGLLGLWLIRRYMPDYRTDGVPPLDGLGFLLFGTAIALLSHVLEVFSEHAWEAGPLLLMTAAAAALFAAYGRHARRLPHAVLQFSLFRIRTFRSSVGGGFVTRLGIGGMPFLLPLLYQLGLGYTPWQAGLLMMPQAAASILMKVLSERVLRRFGFRRVLVGNTVLLGGTIAAFAMVRPGAPVMAVLALSFAQGFFSSLQFTSMNSLVFADVSDRDASQASSIFSTAQQLSLSFGVAISSLVVTFFLRVVHPAAGAGLIGSLHRAFLVLGTLTALCAWTFAVLRPEDGANVSRHRSDPPRALERVGEA